ncbi:hypothetical protein [Xanthomonas phage RTH11]|nr:hypothetical protein [Xanthomonas phage RTH11]
MSKASQRKMTIRQDGYRFAQCGRPISDCPHRNAADRWNWKSGYEEGLHQKKKAQRAKVRRERMVTGPLARWWRMWYGGLTAFGLL